MPDPYKVLGIAKSASEREIKSAYRKLAKIYHPDRNRDDPRAETKFAEATAAYDLLSDKAKRAQFDRGEIDAKGNPKMGGFDFSGMRGGAGRMHGGINPEEILKEFMGGFAGAGRTQHSAGARAGATGGGGGWDPFGGAQSRASQVKGKDFVAPLAISLEQANQGQTVIMRLTSGRTLDVKLPKEVQEVLSALDNVESQFDNCIFMFDTVKQRAEQIISNDHNRVIHAVTVQKVTPMNVALVNIMEAAYDYLLSGDYHIRRGVLLDSGEEIWKISHIATERLVTDGYMTNEEAEKYRADVSEAISGSG